MKRLIRGTIDLGKGFEAFVKNISYWNLCLIEALKSLTVARASPAALCLSVMGIPMT
jgi:hypothetical protein